jgi:hypothetical protein
MITIYEIIGDMIGRNGTNAAYFSTQKDAEEALEAYRRWQEKLGETAICDGPIMIKVCNAGDVVAVINNAIDYATS